MQVSLDYRAELNEEQYQVVTKGDGRCLVLAGAGSGKTRAVTYRVAWLLEHGVQPEEILLLTFTNKAAKEMVTRVEELLGRYPGGLWAGTFHSIANRLLRQLGSFTPYGASFSILDEDDAQDLIKLCTKEVVTGKTHARFPSASVMKGMFSYALNACLPLVEVIEERNTGLMLFQKELEAIFARYQEAKLATRAMDFDDLLTVLLKTLKENEALRLRVAGRFKYVLVDEFQDTNVIQADLVDLLSSVHEQLLVVGDDAQSIYSFRAADIRNILAFPKRYPGASTLRLLTNYRSTPQILALANAVIAHNTGQFRKELHAAVPAGSKPLLVPAGDEGQEARYVADRIVDLVGRGESLSSIAVLFRAAFHSQALEFELMKRSIPYEYRGGQKFFERAHVKDVLAHLRILRNHLDQTAWLRALQLHEGIGLAGANKIVLDILSFPDLAQAMFAVTPKGLKAQTAWQRLLDLITRMRDAGSPARMVRILATSDFYSEYLSAEYQNARERLEDLDQFAVFAEQFEDLGEFLDAITLTGEYGAVEEVSMNSDRIVLSTIHQAKGLEWNAVFLLRVAEGSFPHGRAYGEKGGLEEERRLFYVAVTRARKELTISYPLTSGFRDVELHQPSPFLLEVPPGSFDEVRLNSWGSARPYRPERRQASRSAFRDDPFADDEPAIVLDSSGEQVGDGKQRTGFLGDF